MYVCVTYARYFDQYFISVINLLQLRSSPHDDIANWQGAAIANSTIKIHIMMDVGGLDGEINSDLK